MPLITKTIVPEPKAIPAAVTPPSAAPAPLATREQWLNEAAKLLCPLFEEHGATIPTNTRYSCGWPSKSALSAKKQRIGECWTKDVSGDEHWEIFISPSLGDPIKVLGVLVHEIVHACVGLAAGHRGSFKKLATAVGLEGKMTATSESDALKARLKIISEKLGTYPHAALVGGSNGRKKEGTRLLKISCPDCGYTARVANKWLEVGLPTCCCGAEMEAEQK